MPPALLRSTTTEPAADAARSPEGSAGRAAPGIARHGTRQGCATGRLVWAALILLAGLIGGNLAAYVANPWCLVLVTHCERAVEFDEPPLPDGSLASDASFSYRLPVPFSPAVFREHFGDVVLSGEGFDDARRLAVRVRELLRHGHEGQLVPLIPDECIRTALEKSVLCDGYSKILCAALQHVGHVARVVRLKGHVTTEVFDRGRGRWLYVDADLGVTLRDEQEQPLSISQIIDRMRTGQALVIRPLSEANSPDDALITGLTSGYRSCFESGHTYAYDGVGEAYYRKALWKIGRWARARQLRRGDAPAFVWPWATQAVLNVAWCAAVAAWALRRVS